MESEKDQTLAKLLEKNGLTGQFWIDKLKDNGIENTNQLQHADRRVFNQLSQHVEYPWQKNALKAVFHLEEKTTTEKQELIEKTDNSIKELIKKLDKATDEETRMEKMKISVQIPEGQKNLHEELMKIEQLTTNCELAKREQPTHSQVVTRISAGRILRGYYIQKDLWKRVIPKKQLIVIPDNIQLLAPRMEETFTSKEFFSENKSVLHDHVVHHWGLNAAGSLGSIGAFTVDFGLSMKTTNDVSLSEVSDEGFTEIKETVNVPTASFSLENVTHYLSPEALNELINLESSLSADDGKNTEECTRFFQSFGSHFFAGTYHFGGRYTRSAICRSETTMTKGDSIKLSKNALQIGGAGMYRWFVFGGRVELEKSVDQSTSKYKQNEDYKVEKKIVKCGGPAEVDSIPQWKLGLVKYPSTWNIINMDVHTDEWKGVWDLLSNDLSSKFNNIDKVRSILKRVWEKKMCSDSDK